MTIPPDQWHLDYIPTLEDWQAAFATAAGTQSLAAANAYTDTALAAARAYTDTATAAKSYADLVGASTLAAAQNLAAGKFGFNPGAVDVFRYVNDTSTGAAGGIPLHYADFSIFKTNAGGHTFADNSAMAIAYRPVGSGVTGPYCADYGLTISNIKQNWQNSLVRGELNGITIAVRNGVDDVAGILMNVGTIDGYAAITEGVSSIFDRSENILFQINAQMAPLESGFTGTAYKAGFVATANIGVCDVGLQIQGSAHGLFTDNVRFLNQQGHVYYRVDAFGRTYLANDAATFDVNFHINADGSYGISSSSDAAENLNLSQAGVLSIRGGALKMGTTQVLGPRVFGFGGSIGARNTAGINYDTASQTAINQRVAALEYALVQHGLIGA